ncbi:MAG: EAL domain-containing protein [Pseudomonadota bacterium]
MSNHIPVLQPKMQRRRLLLFLLLVMGVAFVMHAGITAQRSYKTETGNLYRSSKTASELLAHSLSGLIYTFQLDAAKHLLDEAVKRRQFVSGEIVDPDGISLVKSLSGIPAEGELFTIRKIVKTKSGETVGTLTLVVSCATIEAQIRNKFIEETAFGALQMLLILFIVYLGTSKLVTALGQANARMADLATRDSLTGVFNRRGIQDEIVRLASSSKPPKLGLIHLDLDKFKAVNDTLGHAVGDKVLEETARRLKANVRVHDSLARIGGDEFLVVCTIDKSNFDVGRVASRLITALNQPMPEEISRLDVGASAGVIEFELGHPEDFEQALVSADLALYEAKNNGRGCSKTYRDELKSTYLDTENTILAIKKGIANGEFEPWFQPQTNMQTGLLEGVEVLVRWNDPDKGVRSPADFLQIADEAGLLNLIDQQIFDQALPILAKLHENGLHGLTMSFNLTAKRLAEPGLVEQLRRSTLNAGLLSSDIALEIIETVIFDARSSQAIETINALAMAGFRIELDDFGTGRSSIANLIKFPVSKLKIDRQFVAGIDDDADKEKITGAIVRLAEDLGIATLAEGVETEDEFSTVQTMGCGSVQGYFVAKPMREEELESWCMDRASQFADRLVDFSSRLRAAGKSDRRSA